MKVTPTKIKLAAKKRVKEKSFPVVAIGASAGGLEAMMELLKYLPANTGMAFIYVQHLLSQQRLRHGTLRTTEQCLIKLIILIHSRKRPPSGSGLLLLWLVAQETLF